MSGGQSALNRRQRYPCKPEGWKPVPAPTPAEHGVRIQSTEYRHRQADLTIEGLIPYASWGNIRIEHNLSQIHSGNDMFGFLHMRKKTIYSRSSSLLRTNNRRSCRGRNGTLLPIFSFLTIIGISFGIQSYNQGVI